VAESKARALLRGLVREGGLPASPPPGLGLDELARTAARQGVSSLLLAAVERGGAPWAEPLRAGLAAERRARLARALGQIQLLARTAALLAGEGIRTLPLKGAVLAETVYDVECDRPMSDVDLLALERWRDGLALLRRTGFSVLSPGDHAWALRETASGEVLELHRSVTSAPGLFPCDAEGLWARRLPGRAHLASRPSPEDLLLQLALHAAFQHGLVLSLVQWLDFRRVLEREAIDAGRLRGLAEEGRALVPLAAALRVARAVVGAPVPEALADGVPLPRALAVRLRRGDADPLAFVEPAPPALGRVRLELLAGRRAALLWRTLLLPDTTEGDTGHGARLRQAAVRALRLGRATIGRPALAASAEDGTAATPTTASAAAAEPPEVPYAEELLRDCLSSFPHVRMTVRGRCMEPALADGDRVHLVAAAQRAPRVGDVVLSRQADGLRLHRLVWGPPFAARGGPWRTKADRGALLDPPVAPADVLATVSLVEDRPRAAPRRAARALRSLASAVAFRLRRGTGARAEAAP
jgi:hypothetical protein